MVINSFCCFTLLQYEFDIEILLYWMTLKHFEFFCSGLYSAYYHSVYKLWGVTCTMGLVL